MAKTIRCEDDGRTDSKELVSYKNLATATAVSDTVRKYYIYQAHGLNHRNSFSERRITSHL